MKRIAAVVVTYNRSAMLLQCVEKLLAQEGAQCDVLIVDNASTDGTGEIVQKMLSDRVRYRNTGKNIGGAGGFNAGLRWAVEEGYDFAWIMDDDTFPQPDALEKLLQADELLGGGYGFLSSAVLWKDGSGCQMNRCGVHYQYEEKLALLSEGILRLEQATFVSMFLRAETVARCGLPIKEFFIWGDDIEYSRRIALRRKMPSYLVGKSQVVHMMAHNEGSNLAVDAPEKIPRYALAFRNEAYLFRQEGIRGRLFYWRRCAATLKNILLRASNNRARRISALAKGIASGLFFYPKVEHVSAERKGRAQ